jgi:hypothetical protein
LVVQNLDEVQSGFVRWVENHWEGKMTRRILDLALSGGGALLAVLLIVLGLILGNQASFARSYVKDQLGQQKIVFTAPGKLTDEEKNWKPGSTCLTAFGGKTMETGKQAECYANFYIRLHMETAATNAGFSGETYATLGGIQTQLRADIAAANQKNDSQAAATLQKKLDTATSLRTTMQTGETLRGLLLTSFGFSIFGEKAAQASDVCYAAGVVLALLAIAGFVHAAMTSPDRRVWGGSPKLSND